MSVAHNDVFLLNTILVQQINGRDSSSTCARHYDSCIFDLSPGQVAGIYEAGKADNGCPMLIVVEHWDVHQLLESVLNDEAVGRFDIFKVDATKARAQITNTVDEVVGIFAVNADVD